MIEYKIANGSGFVNAIEAEKELNAWAARGWKFCADFWVFSREVAPEKPESVDAGSAKYQLLGAAVGEHNTAMAVTVLRLTDGSRTFCHVLVPTGYVVFERTPDEALSIEIHNFLSGYYEEGANAKR